MRWTRLVAVAIGTLGTLVSALVGVGQDDLGLAGSGEPLKLGLLRLPAVQKELELTSDQQTKINTLSEQTKAARKQIEAASGKVQDQAKGAGAGAGAGPAGIGAGAGGIGFNPEVLQAGLSDLEQRTETALRKLLDAKQRTRLAQIALRAEGPSAFVKPEVIEALNIGQDQLLIIQGIVDGLGNANDQDKESQKQASGLTKGPGDNPGLEKLRKDQQKGMFRTSASSTSKQAMAQIAKVLTRRQRENYNKLLGSPFEFSKVADDKGQQQIGNAAANPSTPLLQEPAVQTELKLNGSQKARLDKGDTPANVLDTRQRTRLNQLALQSEGPSAFARPDFQESLRLSVAQINDLDAILGNVLDASKPQKVQPSPAGSGPRKQVMDQINRLLTRPQRETYSKMLGKPFDFTRLKRDPREKGQAESPTPKAKTAN